MAVILKDKEEFKNKKEKIITTIIVIFSTLFFVTSIVVGAWLSIGEPHFKELKTEEKTLIEYDVTIYVSGLNNRGFKIDLKYKEGQTLMEALKDTGINIDETDGLINGIGSIVANPDNKEFLALYVNGEMATVGANDLKLKDGDVIEFKIENWE